MAPTPTHVVNGKRAIWGVSDAGQLMGNPSATPPEAGLASIEREGTYEHLAVGVLEEGYTLAYLTPGGADNVKFDVYQSSSGIIFVSSQVIQNSAGEFVKLSESRTDDGILHVRQAFIISKNGTRVVIRMDITNQSRTDITDLLIKRYADIDVDTGGTAGWAGFLARWDKNRDSVFTYNLDEDAPEGRRGHIVNMVAIPSDLPLDSTFVGQLGAQQYAFRDNPTPLGPLPTGRVDADGVLQWRASRLLSGESVRINMYYDTWRTFATMPNEL
jgi:hypothetical protein